jgi:hypothetical protein
MTHLPSAATTSEFIDKPCDRARAALLANPDLPQRQVAALAGVSESTVSKQRWQLRRESMRRGKLETARRLVGDD